MYAREQFRQLLQDASKSQGNNSGNYWSNSFGIYQIKHNGMSRRRRRHHDQSSEDSRDWHEYFQ